MASANTEPLRVLWVTKGLGRGGAETILDASLGKFDPDTVQIDVAYVLSHKDALVESMRSTGASVVCLSRHGRWSWPLELAARLQMNRYDVVHSHAPLVGSAVRILSRPGQALVHTEHSAWDRYKMPTRVVNALTMRRSRRVFAVSRAVLASMRSSRMRRLAPLERTEVLYHGVDLTRTVRVEEHRSEARSSLGLGPDTRAVIMVASLTEKKDHNTLLKSFAELRNRVPGVRLCLVGGGPLEGALRAQARDLGLDKAVDFLGVRDDVRRILPAFDALVLPSRHEGLGLVIIEAFAAGIPVVASRVGGIPEIVGDFEGAILVSPGNVQDLTRGLETVLRDPAYAQRARAGGMDIAARFDLVRAVARMTEVYRQMVAL